MTNEKYILGMDIGGTNFRMALVDQKLQVKHLQVYPSADVYNSNNTVDAFADKIKAFISEYATDKSIIAIAIGCPSVVDAQRRRLYSSTNFPGLENIDLVGELEARLNYNVYIDHDAYYLLAFDIWNAGLKNQGTIIGCYFGTGLGNAMYIGGRPYIGKNGTACELGHLAIPQNSYPCSCGNLGCIEMFSCGKALERLGQEYYPETYIGDLFTKFGSDQRLLDFVDYMSVAIAAEVNILDPDYVFVGGGIVQMDSFPKEYLKERVLAHTRKPYPAANLDIRFTTNGPENGIVGAALIAFNVI